MKHWKYLKYLFKHKWYVFVECCKLGIPLRGFVHDWSKFLPSEWFPYAEAFYGEYGYKFNGGFIWQFAKHENAMNRFNLAWLRHQHRNPHHWQHWILVQDDDPTVVLEIPDKYRKEMLADWRGAGRAITGSDNTARWYAEHELKIRLCPKTKEWIDERMKNNGMDA
jgi:hypothetical protein